MLDFTTDYENATKKVKKKVAKTLYEAADKYLCEMASIIFIVKDKDGKFQYREDRMEQGDVEYASSNDPTYDIYFEFGSGTLSDVYKELGIEKVKKKVKKQVIKPIEKIFKISNKDEILRVEVSTDNVPFKEGTWERDYESFKSLLGRLSELNGTVKSLYIVTDWTDPEECKEMIQVVLECSQLENVDSLTIDSFKLEVLPKEISNLKGLTDFRLNKCYHLKDISTIEGLPVKSLMVYKQNKIDDLPLCKTLETVTLKYSGHKTKFPIGLDCLKSIEVIDCSDVCFENITDYKSLESLRIRDSRVSKLPKINSLKELLLKHNSGLEVLPEMPLVEKVKIFGWNSLKNIDKIINSKKLKSFYFDEREEVEKIPSGIFQLPEIESIEISNCQRVDRKTIVNIEEVSKSLNKLHLIKCNVIGSAKISNMKELNFSSCFINWELFNEQVSIETLLFNNTEFKQLPDLSNVNGAKHIEVVKCNWEKFPNINTENTEHVKFTR